MAHASGKRCSAQSRPNRAESRTEAARSLDTAEARADFVHRICGAWDYGVVPTRETFEMLSGWREVFERFPIRDSPAFHAFCERFGWPHGHGRITRARYEVLDAREGRTDPFAGTV
jgi:hypothetical protein